MLFWHCQSIGVDISAAHGVPYFSMLATAPSCLDSPSCSSRGASGISLLPKHANCGIPRVSGSSCSCRYELLYQSELQWHSYASSLQTESCMEYWRDPGYPVADKPHELQCNALAARYQGSWSSTSCHRLRFVVFQRAMHWPR